MSNRDFTPQNFGLKKGYLYEVIATTFLMDGLSIRPNAACMGIRLLEDNRISINPYPTTITFRNLKRHSQILINFVDDIHLYALAALKGENPHIEFTSKYYGFIDIIGSASQIPYIKKAWGYLLCEVDEEVQKIKQDALGEVVMTEFRLKVIQSEKLKDSFSLYNRAENLALESIIIATRIRIAKGSNNDELYETLMLQLQSNIENIRRFSKNNRAIKAINLVRKYVDSL